MLTFPDLHGARFGHINLDVLARAHAHFRDAALVPQLIKQKVVTNPLLDPHLCHEMIQEAHAHLGIDHSYGGWFEDRRVLWKDSYLEKGQHWIHLGVDFNVPAKTRVVATWKATMELVDDDTPMIGGWGPRVILRLKDDPDLILIFAHLGEVSCKAGDKVKPGDTLATVGSPPHNGMWFPHLHVQAVDLKHYKRDWTHLVQELDGYANPFAASHAATIFPDPMRYMRLWE